MLSRRHCKKIAALHQNRKLAHLWYSFHCAYLCRPFTAQLVAKAMQTPKDDDVLSSNSGISQEKMVSATQENYARSQIHSTVAGSQCSQSTRAAVVAEVRT
jgi:hypothetical protein